MSGFIFLSQPNAYVVPSAWPQEEIQQFQHFSIQDQSNAEKIETPGEKFKREVASRIASAENDALQINELEPPFTRTTASTMASYNTDPAFEETKLTCAEKFKREVENRIATSGNAAPHINQQAAPFTHTALSTMASYNIDPSFEETKLTCVEKFKREVKNLIATSGNVAIQQAAPFTHTTLSTTAYYETFLASTKSYVTSACNVRAEKFKESERKSTSRLLEKSNPVILQNDKKKVGSWVSNNYDEWLKIGKIQFNRSSKNIIGKGSEGTRVYKGKFGTIDAAIKRIQKTSVESTDYDRIREIELLQKSDKNPHVIRYYDSEVDSDYVYIALELADYTLQDYVLQPKIKSEFPYTSKVDISGQIAKGLSHLHDLNIIHRDLKPSNILLEKYKKGIAIAKIADLGISKILNADQTSVTKTMGVCGSEGWQAPEMLQQNSRITFAVDMFSFGLVNYYLLTDGKNPYDHNDYHINKNISDGNYNITSLSPVEKNFIEALIQPDPSRRVDIQTAMLHPMYWEKKKQLDFFMDINDWNKNNSDRNVIVRLERYGATSSANWFTKLPEQLKNDLQGTTYTPYNPNSTRGLIKAILPINEHCSFVVRLCSPHNSQSAQTAACCMHKHNFLSSIFFATKN